jgi:protein kinase C substrate 80K-H
VNDGVCDYETCCDGSDEWEGVGGVKCEDRCKQIGKEWRKNDEKRRKSRTAALKRKKELVTQAGRLKKEMEDRISTLKVEIAASEVKVKALEKELADVEIREAGKVVKTSGKSRVNVLAGLAKERVEELRETLIDVRGQRDAWKNRVLDLEKLLTTFKEEYNPNFNDEGVKRAVRGWDDYLAQEKFGEAEAAFERDLDEIVKPDDAEAGINWPEWDKPDEERDTDICKRPISSIPYFTSLLTYRLQKYTN